MTRKSTNLHSDNIKKELEFEADVLFQRLGNKWYAFSVVEEECLVTEVSEDEVQKRMHTKRPKAA